MTVADRNRRYYDAHQEEILAQKLARYQGDAEHAGNVRVKRRERYASTLLESRAKMRTDNAEKRRRLNDIKLACGCVDCGYKEHASALHFDHLPQYKKRFNLGTNLANRRWETILAEVNKCEVRCANCHGIKTHQRRSDESRRCS